VEDKIRELEHKVNQLHLEAKDFLAKSQASKGTQKEMFKKKALMALNKKKQYENQMKTYMNHQMTIDSINMTTENIKNHQ
jgi:hypothetical protein